MKTSKLQITGLCERNSLVPGEFPAKMASNAENVSIWWRHHELEFGGVIELLLLVKRVFLCNISFLRMSMVERNHLS